jgi:hypothetical protein
MSEGGSGRVRTTLVRVSDRLVDAARRSAAGAVEAADTFRSMNSAVGSILDQAGRGRDGLLDAWRRADG